MTMSGIHFQLAKTLHTSIAPITYSSISKGLYDLIPCASPVLKICSYIEEVYEPENCYLCLKLDRDRIKLLKVGGSCMRLLTCWLCPTKTLIHFSVVWFCRFCIFTA